MKKGHKAFNLKALSISQITNGSTVWLACLIQNRLEMLPLESNRWQGRIRKDLTFKNSIETTQHKTNEKQPQNGTQVFVIQRQPVRLRNRKICHLALLNTKVSWIWCSLKIRLVTFQKPFWKRKTNFIRKLKSNTIWICSASLKETMTKCKIADLSQIL